MNKIQYVKSKFNEVHIKGNTSTGFAVRYVVRDNTEKGALGQPLFRNFVTLSIGKTEKMAWQMAYKKVQEMEREK